METNINTPERRKKDCNGRRKTDKIGADFFEKQWEQSWTHIKTVVDVVREPMLILDKQLCVLVANRPFYKTFLVEENETVGTDIFKLGNGQWNIDSLKKMLETVILYDTNFNGFKVTHNFPTIGHKVMILNARQIHTDGQTKQEPIILLAIEDITEMLDVAEQLANHIKQFEHELTNKTEKLEHTIDHINKEIIDLQKKPPKPDMSSSYYSLI